MSANVALSETFDQWRVKTNELLVMTQTDGSSNFIKLSNSTDSSSNTFFEGIQSLPPGHNLTVGRDGVLVINSWYSIKNRIRILNNPSDPEEFRFLLKNSIKLRMRSDVHICSSLSGGLDSSSIIALISELLR